MKRGGILRYVGAVAGALALLAAACGGDDGDASEDAPPDEPPADGAEADQPGEASFVFPGEDWETADPEEMGFDAGRLEELATEAQDIGSSCMLVSRQGRIVGEWYWNDTDAGTTHEAFSATKSFTSALVGIAQEDGDLDLEDSASEYIDQWVGTPSEEVTIRNLVSGDSGLHAEVGFGITGAEDATAYGIDLAQDDPPGTTWANNEPAIQTLEAVLEAATGQQPAAYAQERLLDPIGASSTEMGHDPAGNTYMFWNLQTTCRDAARFGYLFLRNGNWDGEQVVPEEWVAESTGQSSQEVNPGYGYLWWLNRSGGADADIDPMNPGAPEEMYWALGAFGQIIQVDPGSETVVVRFGQGAEVYDMSAVQTTARVVVDAFEG